MTPFAEVIAERAAHIRTLRGFAVGYAICAIGLPILGAVAPTAGMRIYLYIIGAACALLAIYALRLVRRESRRLLLDR